MRKMSVSVAGMLAVGLMGGCVSQEARTADTLPAYIGPYTGGSGSKGVYRIWVDRQKGIVSKPELVAEVPSPSFLTFGDRGRKLYAVSESSSKVLAYDVANHDGMLTLLNEAGTGAGPCHVAILGDRFLAVANYGGGSVELWSVSVDGRMNGTPLVDQYTHASKATNRQQKPHAHGVTFTPDQQGLLVPDLGADRVYVYRLMRAKSTLHPHETAPWIELPPGRGPRHVKFPPDGQNHLYVLNELSNTVSVFDTKKDVFTFIEEVSTLPAGFDGQSTSAELVFSPDGKTLYTSNRGHDSIARFTRDPKTGRLTRVECVPCGGKCPRDFTIMPGGGLMLVANQNSNNIAVFRIAKDGALTLMPDAGVEIGAPVCVQFE